MPHIAGFLGALCNGLGARSIVAPQDELIEELARSVAEVLATARTSRHAGQRLPQTLSRWRVRREPF